MTVAEGDPAVRDDAEVAEDRDVVRRVPPLHLPCERIDRPDVVVVRGDVERAVLLDRVRLLPPADVHVDLAEVEGVEAPELGDVVGRDLRER